MDSGIQKQLSGVKFWLKIWNWRVKVARRAEAKTRGGQNKKTAVFTHASEMYTSE